MIVDGQIANSNTVCKHDKCITYPFQHHGVPPLQGQLHCPRPNYHLDRPRHVPAVVDVPPRDRHRAVLCPAARPHHLPVHRQLPALRVAAVTIHEVDDVVERPQDEELVNVYQGHVGRVARVPRDAPLVRGYLHPAHREVYEAQVVAHVLPRFVPRVDAGVRGGAQLKL